MSVLSSYNKNVRFVFYDSSIIGLNPYVVNDATLLCLFPRLPIGKFDYIYFLLAIVRALVLSHS